MVWGIHTIINARRCPLSKLQSPVNILNFNNTLIHKIKMIPYGKPQLEMFGSGDAKGYTLVQLIHTSNIMAHFSESGKTAFIDVFSCKDYDSADVKAVVEEYFSPEEIELCRITRDCVEKMRLV